MRSTRPQAGSHGSAETELLPTVAVSRSGRSAAFPQRLGGEVAPDDEHGGGGLRDEPCQVGKRPSQRPAQYGSSRPSIGVTPIQPTFCIVCTVVPTMTTSTQVMRTPVAMSIFLCGSFRSSATTSTKTPTTPSEPERDALEHGERSRLERHRLQEEHGLEALAVDAREAEEHEADHLRRGEREARSCEDAPLPLVEALEVLLPVHLVEEPVEDQEQDADRDERDDASSFSP